MKNKTIAELKVLIKETRSRMEPLKPLMREDELEDFEFYESFDITPDTGKNICVSILERLTIIETRHLKKKKHPFLP